ncbi:phosphotransferase family protein [Sporichthya sp.]|uniref:phosphotransferase family protein n=1 Tax=Sporichthya sp. TaxID=65475 RepID=UPI0017A71B2B|nr:phosphotransferase family protein [Sporichthya sp.]MBA3744520.1 phosphotransferase family protein [Sporichthya sp.]
MNENELFEDEDIFESTPGTEGGLRGQILDFMRDQLNDEAGPQLESDVVPIAGGSSQQHFAFTASWFNGTKRVKRQLILRQEPASGIVEANMALESVVLSAMRGGQIPIPMLQWSDLTPSYFDTRTLVFERSRGEADRAVLRDKDPFKLGAEGRVDLARSMAGLLAELHAMDPAEASLDLVMPYPDDAVMSEVNKWDYAVDRESLDPDQRLKPARDWLQINLQQAPGYLCLVHGDFRPANILVDDGRISALLDWEMAHLGDPAEDVGWYTCSIYRTEHFPAGWSVEDFLARYVDMGGPELEPERVKFWQVFAVFKLTVIALRAIRKLESGLTGPRPPVDRLIDQLNADIA